MESWIASSQTLLAMTKGVDGRIQLWEYQRMTPLPVPAIDHVVINVRDRLDEAAATYQRLGFALTPRGHHTLGSSNNLAILGTDYIELLGVVPGVGNRTDVLDWPAGLNGLVFKTFDGDATFAALQSVGVPVLPPQEFSRPVEILDGVRDAAFRTVRLERDAVPAGRVFFCHHLTPELVWHDAWRRHPNGAIGIARAVICATDPAALGGLFARMFGADSVRQVADGCTLSAALARVDVVTPAALEAEFGADAPAAEGRDQFMAALTLRTLSVGQTARALQEGGIAATRDSRGITVAATEACGVTLVFQD
jgi:catechol 2,3-dioxygenase-like lactoylglutathione lyase family enzyme